MPINHLILCHSLLLPPSIFPSIRSFPMCQFFTSSGQSIEVSASASVLPMNTQDWSPLGLTGWISLQSKGLSSLLQHHSSKNDLRGTRKLLNSKWKTEDHFFFLRKKSQWKCWMKVKERKFVFSQTIRQRMTSKNNFSVLSMTLNNGGWR